MIGGLTVSTVAVQAIVVAMLTLKREYLSAFVYNPGGVYPAGSVPPDWEGTILLHWEEGDHAGKAHEVWTVPQG